MVATAAAHALWRSGVGLSLWFTDADGQPCTGHVPDGLPEPIATAVSGRSLRRTITVAGPGPTRRDVSSLTLGPAASCDLLRSVNDDPAVGGELRYYRFLLESTERFVSAGAVAPAVNRVAGEWAVRWAPLTTAGWRAWLSTAIASAPPVILENGDSTAIMDFCGEMTDHLCRIRCSDIAPHSVRSSLVRGLLPDTDSPEMSAERAASAAAAWASWADGLRQGESALVLRLCEPDEDDNDDSDLVTRWRLQVCRRTMDRPDQPVELRRLDPHQIDEITTEVAGAVRAFPDLKAAHHDHHSLDFLLSTDTVLALLDTGVAALADAGFEVLLPRSIAHVRPTLTLRGKPEGGPRSRAVMVGLGEIRDFQWQLALGDDILDASELEALARQKGDLVRIRGKWVRADNAALSRSAAFIQTQRALAESGQPADMGELFNLVTDGDDRLPLPVGRVEGLSWLDDIKRGGQLAPPPLEAPASLRAELRPYQHRGMEWLRHLSSLGIGAVLADDMGLGKTIQVLALICGERAPDDVVSRTTLLVCPMSVVGNWEREITKFAPHLTVLVHHGPGRLTKGHLEPAAAKVDVVITTFAIASRDRALLSAVKWDRLVVDEAQHIKNVNTAQSKAVRAMSARHRVALTGTPVENRLEDLRSVIDLVNPGLLGTASVFKNRYAEPIERERDRDAVRRLSAVTSPFILRRVKTDPSVISDLPEKTELTVRANLTVEQAGLYRAVIDDLMDALGKGESRQPGSERRRTVFAALTRLKQICNHPAHYLGDGSPILRRNEHRSGKVELLADMLENIVADGERALVFTQFTAFGTMLEPWLSDRLGHPLSFLHGGLSRPARDKLVAEFGEADGPPVMMASLKAGGTGLNLTAANHVVHFDRWWNPAVENQATDRVYRIGQERRVEVRKFVCVGTLEERIDQLISDKRELSELTVATGENWLADTGDDELYELMRLHDEAVSE
ncbi:DEAD/DEAH box helicase [Williamsia muralis]|uniref:DEAD/DEAH box helicase n=1 Tax=Williamsia marianensis TaxID=85044 RepID=A0ABU4EPQ2_WILMA|nr:DEAD/DEAH box helicase [Williamsia muralis]MDV7133225.1 DEAD/DEAH box helicase [Williamsia muralis]